MLTDLEEEPIETGSDRDVVADLQAARQDLQIGIHDLKVLMPPITLDLLCLLVTFCLLLASLALTLTPYISDAFPALLSTVAAFLVVIFSFSCYLLFRKVQAEYERRRLYKSLIHRAAFVAEAADNLIKNLPPNVSNQA
jgi:4-hydroxybenzoate polyprenyltransferase